MNINEVFSKLNFFGDKSDLEISEVDQVVIEDMVIMEPELFEAIKRVAYSKMTVLARKFINARPEETPILQARIKSIDDFIQTLANIKSYKAVKELEPKQFSMDGQHVLKKMLGIKDEAIATEKQRKYTINDYMESKDFNGDIGVR